MRSSFLGIRIFNNPQSLSLVEGREFSEREQRQILSVIRTHPELVMFARGGEDIRFGRLSMSLQEAVGTVCFGEKDRVEEALSVPELKHTHFFDLLKSEDFKGAVIHELVHYAVFSDQELLSMANPVYKRVKLKVGSDVMAQRILDVEHLIEGCEDEEKQKKLLSQRDGMLSTKSRIDRLKINEDLVSDYAAVDSEEFLCETMRFYLLGKLDRDRCPVQYALAQNVYKFMESHLLPQR